MSSDSNGGAFAHAGHFDFTVRADADNVSISRPASPEDVERLRRQLAEWESRFPAQPA